MRVGGRKCKAAAEIGEGVSDGAEIGSRELVFRPGKMRAGEYRFAVGTAGSTTLVLQTILPALILADGPSRLVLEGGTHNPLAPSFDFLPRTFLPLLNRFVPVVEATLVRPGFAPAGWRSRSRRAGRCRRGKGGDFTAKSAKVKREGAETRLET
jgi:RNA 3'-terminal phosphate cyclase (ATP)